MTDYETIVHETILVETRGRVGWITLNRPEALNALNTQVMKDVVAAASAFDADEAIGAIVVTGSERAFAAGADIKEMESKSGGEMLTTDHFGGWAQFAAYYKAAELILTGRMMDAAEAERAGLVSRVVPAADLLAEAEKMAQTIAAKSLPSLYAAKAVLDAAMETPMAEGLRLERHVFAALFDTADQKEGMAAFREKRPPHFENR